MPLVTIIPIVGLIALPIFALAKFIQFKKIIKKLEQQILVWGNKRSLHFLGVLICMPIVISLNFFRSFDVLTTIAITGSGLLGFIIAFKDIVFSRLNGLYQNALVWQGEPLFFEHIDCVNRIDPYSIEIITKNRIRKIISHRDVQISELIETTCKKFHQS